MGMSIFLIGFESGYTANFSSEAPPRTLLESGLV